MNYGNMVLISLRERFIAEKNHWVVLIPDSIPRQLFSKYLLRSSALKCNTRHCRDLQIPRYRTEFAKKGFHYSALKACNDTPAELRELQTLNSIKKQLKTYLKG